MNSIFAYWFINGFTFIRKPKISKSSAKYPSIVLFHFLECEISPQGIIKVLLASPTSRAEATSMTIEKRENNFFFFQFTGSESKLGPNLTP